MESNEWKSVPGHCLEMEMNSLLHGAEIPLGRAGIDSCGECITVTCMVCLGTADRGMFRVRSSLMHPNKVILLSLLVEHLQSWAVTVLQKNEESKIVVIGGARLTEHVAQEVFSFAKGWTPAAHGL